MVIAVLRVELHIPYAQSLKDKRMVLRRVKDRLQKFNVAVAEVEHQDLWQRTALGVVAISTTAEHVEQMLASAADEIDRVRDRRHDRRRERPLLGGTDDHDRPARPCPDPGRDQRERRRVVAARAAARAGRDHDRSLVAGYGRE